MSVTSNPSPETLPLLENGTRPPNFLARLKEVAKYRELLGNLTRRDLKVRYKNSVLGVLWTLLNPLLYLAVFSLVFGFFLTGGAPRYGLLLLSGLLIFNLFSVGLSSATTSIVGNAPLVQKVWFPREILPLSTICSTLITFLFQAIILLVGLAVFSQAPQWSMIWLLIPAMAATLAITIGLGLLLSALNVYYRDVQHFLELGLMTWFWMTPIVYEYNHIATSLTERWGQGAERLALLNPITPIVITFQRVLYNPTNFDQTTQTEHFSSMLRPTSWYLQNLGFSLGLGLTMIFVGFKVFTRLEANLGEEL